MFTAHFQQPHRQPEHRPDIAIAAGSLNLRMAAVTPRQLDSLHVRPAHFHTLVEHSAHPPGTPDV